MPNEIPKNMLEVLKRNPGQIVEWVTKETSRVISSDIRGISKKIARGYSEKNMTVSSRIS